jgi:3-oxoacyl-[acyl-carrier protein] reductase
MDTGLKGKTVFIVGAGRNMGRAAALGFAGEGANLVMCNSTNVEELNAAAAAVRALGVTVVADQCDITDPAAVNRFVQKAHHELGRIDVVVNCASFRCDRPFLEETLDNWSRNFAVNLTGPFNVCRAVVPLMMERGWGRIINISGVAANFGRGVAKSAAKEGVIGFTRGLAAEFGKYNITANCINPGTIERAVEPRKNRHTIWPHQPIQRNGTVDEIVAMLLYLASEKAGFITGQCYAINGGSYFQ